MKTQNKDTDEHLEVLLKRGPDQVTLKELNDTLEVKIKELVNYSDILMRSFLLQRSCETPFTSSNPVLRNLHRR